jgi:PncC family amidohydrolase
MDSELFDLSSQLGQLLIAQGLTVSTAESCTGGLLGHILTGVSGSSAYYLGGVIAYSNDVKEALLGVQHSTLVQYGAVSGPTAKQMALGIREKIGADLGLSTTGIAGPTGGTPTKPVGLVYIGISTQDETASYECHFDGTREEIKANTVREILNRLIAHLN